MEAGVYGTTKGGYVIGEGMTAFLLSGTSLSGCVLQDQPYSVRPGKERAKWKRQIIQTQNVRASHLLIL